MFKLSKNQMGVEHSCEKTIVRKIMVIELSFICLPDTVQILRLYLVFRCLNHFNTGNPDWYLDESRFWVSGIQIPRPFEYCTPHNRPVFS